MNMKRSILNRLGHGRKTSAVRTPFLIMTLAMALAALSSSTPMLATSTPRVQVILTRLVCNHTTEWGHDEVYYLLGGVNGSRTGVGKRGPNYAQHADADNGTAWDMNDSGSKKDRYLNAVLYEAPLATGETATLNYGFIESDGTDYGKTLQAAAALASKQVQNPYVKVIASLVSILSPYIPTNQDDILGGFYLQLKNNNGNLNIVNTTAAPYTTVVQPVNNAGGTFSYRFRHDDGDYNAYFTVRLVN